MGYSVKILKDSICYATGKRITTWELTYPRFIHAELMTHRMLSKNSASSRAIPVSKLIERVRRDPAFPVWWGANQSGMQAKAELVGWRRKAAEWLWFKARWIAIACAWVLLKVGLHKQIANRILEPWMYITVILTGTEFDNLWKLRCHPDAQPEFQYIARWMKDVYDRSKPKPLSPGEWHVPLVSMAELAELGHEYEKVLKVATGRCARVSYLTHDGKRDFQADVDLHDRLLDSGHWSPFEHCAQALTDESWSGNFQGWKQYRKQFQGEDGRG